MYDDGHKIGEVYDEETGDCTSYPRSGCLREKSLGIYVLLRSLMLYYPAS